MSVTISPTKAHTKKAGTLSVNGRANLTYACDPNGVTRIKDLYQSDPLRILFPNTLKDEITQSAIVTTSGGLVGGDNISIDVNLGEKAQAQVIAQAAEKIYRSNGPETQIIINLVTEAGGWLEFLPQETILFEGSRLRRRTNINVIDGGCILAGEIIVFGRLGYGEKLRTGLVHDVWDVRQDGRLVWSDAFHLENEIPLVIANPACFDGAVAMATVIYMGPSNQDNLRIARKIVEKHQSDGRSAVTCVNGVLVTRWLGKDVLKLRNEFGFFWATFRNKLTGLPTQLPRLWHM